MPDKADNNQAAKKRRPNTHGFRAPSHALEALMLEAAKLEGHKSIGPWAKDIAIHRAHLIRDVVEDGTFVRFDDRIVPGLETVDFDDNDGRLENVETAMQGNVFGPRGRDNAARWLAYVLAYGNKKQQARARELQQYDAEFAALVEAAIAALKSQLEEESRF